MSDPQPASSSPRPPEANASGPAENAGHSPVKRVKPAPRTPARAANTGPAEQRRDFFSDAMREALIPLSGLLERKINPLLAALEAIPEEVDRFTSSVAGAGRALDQPQINNPRGQPKNLPLAQFHDETPARFLRPPGAVPGPFETLCTACGQCVEACPAHAIRIDPYKHVADGLPYIVGAEQACVVCTPLACMSACPSGALKLTDRLKIRMGTARVNLELCLRENGEDCKLCLEACPIMGEGAGEAGDALAIHPDTGRVRVRRHVCIGCGLCENRCPTRPAAIFVEPYRPSVDPIIA